MKKILQHPEFHIFVYFGRNTRNLILEEILGTKQKLHIFLCEENVIYKKKKTKILYPYAGWLPISLWYVLWNIHMNPLCCV